MAHSGVVLVVSSAQIIMWGGSWKCHNCFMSPILVVEEQNGDDFLPSENSFANNERVLSSRRLWFILWSVWFWKKAICLIIFCNKMISKSISITQSDFIWLHNLNWVAFLSTVFSQIEQMQITLEIMLKITDILLPFNIERTKFKLRVYFKITVHYFLFVDKWNQPHRWSICTLQVQIR